MNKHFFCDDVGGKHNGCGMEFHMLAIIKLI